MMEKNDEGVASDPQNIPTVALHRGDERSKGVVKRLPYPFGPEAFGLVVVREAVETRDYLRLVRVGTSPLIPARSISERTNTLRG